MGSVILNSNSSPVQQENIVVDNIFAFFQRRIPYIPELRSICNNNTNATLLLQQLEYWFAKKPNGFYKFKKACKHHEDYRKGDSWCEEMCFTEREFIKAFDDIGIRYKSKKEFEAYQYLTAKEAASKLDWKKVNPDKIVKRCPFQGYMYLSYLNGISRNTHYMRNHAFVSSVIKKVIEEFNTKQAEPLDSTIDNKKSFREIPRQTTKSHLANSHNGICLKDNKSSAYIQEITQEITAEEAGPKKTHCAVDNFVAQTEADSAASILSEIDQFHVRRKVTALMKDGYLNECDKQKAIEVIMAKMLSKQGFKADSLLHKLNKICVAIKQKNFDIHSEVIVEQVEEKKLQEKAKSEIINQIAAIERSIACEEKTKANSFEAKNIHNFAAKMESFEGKSTNFVSVAEATEINIAEYQRQIADLKVELAELEGVA